MLRRGFTPIKVDLLRHWCKYFCIQLYQDVLVVKLVNHQLCLAPFARSKTWLPIRPPLNYFPKKPTTILTNHPFIVLVWSSNCWVHSGLYVEKVSFDPNRAKISDFLNQLQKPFDWSSGKYESKQICFLMTPF